MSNTAYARTRTVAVGKSLTNLNPNNIVQDRNPTVNDKGQNSQTWTNPLLGTVFTYASMSSGNGQNIWVQNGGSGAGIFTSLVVTPGPISLTGTTTINTSGSAVTTIGTGGTGAVNIGNATGNTAVTGNLSATGDISGLDLIITGNSTLGGTTNSLTVLGNNNGTTTVDINVGSGGFNISGNTVSSGTLKASTLYATGDAGGAAASTALSNVSVPVAGGTGVFVIHPSTGAGNTANTGFIKLYLGTVAIYIPYWTQTT